MSVQVRVQLSDRTREGKARATWTFVEWSSQNTQFIISRYYFFLSHSIFYKLEKTVACLIDPRPSQLNIFALRKQLWSHLFGWLKRQTAFLSFRVWRAVGSFRPVHLFYSCKRRNFLWIRWCNFFGCVIGCFIAKKLCYKASKDEKKRNETIETKAKKAASGICLIENETSFGRSRSHPIPILYFERGII